MTKTSIINEYFEWLTDLVCGERYPDVIPYEKLLMHLHKTEFRWSMLMDENRAKDGISMRYRFAIWHDEPYERVEEVLNGECSVLEMMIALAIRCEENIMDDPTRGDRTSQWFWDMIVNLGLGSMTDNRYDPDLVTDILERFLDREYDPDGHGGLFRIRDPNFDARDMEIWHQLCIYLEYVA